MMKNRSVAFAMLLMLLAPETISAAGWKKVAPGVSFRHYGGRNRSIYVTKIDLHNDAIRLIATSETDRGKRVGEFARANEALVAINADYFNPDLQPVGLTVGPCGKWSSTSDTEREGVVAYGSERISIRPQKEVMDPPEEWVEAAVSGWPMIVKECHALTAKELPGSVKFTHSPHPRTAVGISKDGRWAYFVVAEGRQEDVGGLTLPQLATFMRKTLGTCSAMNLDGGGSSAMWVNDRIVNRPSDGPERQVGNHLGVVLREHYQGCATN